MVDMRTTETRATAMKRVSTVSVSCVHKKRVGILGRGGYGGAGKWPCLLAAANVLFVHKSLWVVMFSLILLLYGK